MFVQKESHDIIKQTQSHMCLRQYNLLVNFMDGNIVKALYETNGGNKLLCSE